LTDHAWPLKFQPNWKSKMDEVISHYPSPNAAPCCRCCISCSITFRYISDEAVNWVAAKLGLEPIQVLEVVTFYPGFRQSAPGKYHIRVCRTLSCAMAGSYELMESFCKDGNIDRSHCRSSSPDRQ
jgi:NADH-quinone oxidoreductase subunit E